MDGVGEGDLKGQPGSASTGGGSGRSRAELPAQRVGACDGVGLDRGRGGRAAGRGGEGPNGGTGVAFGWIMAWGVWSEQGYATLRRQGFLLVLSYNNDGGCSTCGDVCRPPALWFHGGEPWCPSGVLVWLWTVLGLSGLSSESDTTTIRRFVSRQTPLRTTRRTVNGTGSVHVCEGGDLRVELVCRST